jgi:hypothetical protein
MVTTHELLHLDKLSMVGQKIMDIRVYTSFIWTIILFNEAFKYGDYEMLGLCWVKCWTTL